MKFFGGEALIFTKLFRGRPTFFRGRTSGEKPYLMEVLSECNFSKSSGVRRKNKSSTRGYGVP